MHTNRDLTEHLVANMAERNEQNLQHLAAEEGMGGQDSRDEENTSVLELKRRLHHYLSPPLVRTVCGRKIPRRHMIFQVLLWIFLIPQVTYSFTFLFNLFQEIKDEISDKQRAFFTQGPVTEWAYPMDPNMAQ